MKYQMSLEPQNWNILKAASKGEHHYEIASRAFLHAILLKNFACGGLTRLVAECLLLMTT